MKEFFNKYFNLKFKKWILFVLVVAFLLHLIPRFFLSDFFSRQRVMLENDAVVAKIETVKILEGIYEFPFNLERVKNSRETRTRISDGIKRYYGECMFRVKSSQNSVYTIRVSYEFIDTELQIKSIEEYKSKKPIYIRDS